MKRVCAWCGRDLGATDDGYEEISHGICESCCDTLLHPERENGLGAFLERFAFPVLVVNSSSEAVDGNGAALSLVGRNRSQIKGELLGVVFECEYSHLPGGCGKTIHCQGCAIRKSVEHTFESGEPLYDVPSFVDCSKAGATDRQELKLTTWKSGEAVFLKIDRVQAASASRV